MPYTHIVLYAYMYAFLFFIGSYIYVYIIGTQPSYVILYAVQRVLCIHAFICICRCRCICICICVYTHCSMMYPIGCYILSFANYLQHTIYHTTASTVLIDNTIYYYYSMPCSGTLHGTVLYGTLLCFLRLCSTLLYFNFRYCIEMYFTILYAHHCSRLYDTVYCTTLHYNLLCYASRYSVQYPR